MAKRSRRFFKKMELPEMYWQYWWKTYCDRGPRTQREFVFLIIRDFTALSQWLLQMPTTISCISTLGARDVYRMEECSIIRRCLIKWLMEDLMCQNRVHYWEEKCLSHMCWWQITLLQSPGVTRGLLTPERIYNHRISRARRIIKKVFGIWNSKYRIFIKSIDLHPNKINNITLLLALKMA